MPGLFHDYPVVILDASFFAGEFSAVVRHSLEEVSVYVSDTFNPEVAQYRQMLSPGKRAVYDANIAFLQKEIPLRRLNFTTFYGKIPGVEELQCDTWGLVNLMARMGAKKRFLLLTADQLMIQRIVLKELKADVYDMGANRFLRQEDYPRLKEAFAFRESGGVVESWDADEHVTDGDTLYSKDGRTVTLGRQIKAGLEARLFLEKRDPNLIIKIFKKDRLPQIKLENIIKIQGINRKMDVEWALFPLDVVYYDRQCTAPAGFTERYALTRENLDDNPLYLGDVDLPDQYLKTRVSDTVKLCLKTIRQVRYLNSFGFLVSDFNMGNFAMPMSGGDCLQMWDTDSFGYEGYFSGYCSGSRTSRDYDITNKEGAIDFCSEAVYLFAFGLLSLGDEPISEFSGKFKYDNPKYGALYRQELFPKNLWKLFAAVFRKEKMPSVEVLMLEMQAALEYFDKNPAEDKTYKELLFGVVEEEANQTGGQQPGYVAGQQPGGQKTGQTGASWGGQVGKQPGNMAGPQAGVPKTGQPGVSWGGQVGQQPGNMAGQQAGVPKTGQTGASWGGQVGKQPGNMTGQQTGQVVQQTGHGGQQSGAGSWNNAPGGSWNTGIQTNTADKQDGLPGWAKGLLIGAGIFAGILFLLLLIGSI